MPHRQTFYNLLMHPDDHVCLCFGVSLRKIRAFLRREDPSVPSLISECLGAGTGCMWCVPFLKHLHDQHTKGQMPDLRISPQQYAAARTDYRGTGTRDKSLIERIEAAEEPPAPDDDADAAGGHHPDHPPTPGPGTGKTG